MADNVTTQIIDDGAYNTVVRLTNVSDGTGESAVTKVDQALLSANSLGFLANRLRLDKIKFATVGMGFQLFWGGSPNILLWDGPASFAQTIDFRHPGGGLVPPPALIAPTGKILLTTFNQANGTSYVIVLSLKKFYPPLGN